MCDTPPTSKAPFELLHLAANKPAAIRARRATVVACLAGELWITLDGDRQDYTVSYGRKFLCGRDARLLINSLNAPGVAMIYQSQRASGGALADSGVQEDADSRQHLTRFAHEQRRAAIHQAANWFKTLITKGWRARPHKAS